MYSPYMLEIITPEKTFFQGNVTSLIIETDSGQIGVLKGHVPMVAVLKAGEIRFNTDGEWKSAVCSQGFIEVKGESAMIFAQSAEWPEDIDVKRAEEARIRAEEKLRMTQNIQEFTAAKASLARALIRLKKGSDREK